MNGADNISIVLEKLQLSDSNTGIIKSIKSWYYDDNFY